MRRLPWKGAAVAIVVVASGAAGQMQSGARTDGVVIPLPAAAPMPPPAQHSAIVERLLSFDANGDWLIARDELPERMQPLVGRGDKNHDLVLNSDEISALVAAPSPRRVAGRFEVRSATLADIVVDLKLPPATHDRAMALVQEHTVRHQINVGNELDAAMRALLDDEDYENFIAAAARLRTTRRGVVGGVVAPPVAPLPPARAPVSPPLRRSQ